ncbi:MAG TPA: sugar-binding protein [Tepidisphaeraceae bacterium]|jgi:hypothetical protein|nr:sugar-binding protein [Tepidisphaeraceae bacterium]
MIRNVLCTVVLFGLSVVTASISHAVDVKLGLNGIDVDAGPAGSFVLHYPKLAKGEKKLAPIEKVIGDASALFKYEGGAQLTVEIREGGLLQLHVQNAGPNVDSIRLDMNITGSARGQLKWAANGGTPAEVPVTYAGTPFLFKGDAKRFELVAENGDGLAIIQPHGFQQLQDNREWNTDTCSWFSVTRIPFSRPGEAYVVYAIVNPGDKAPALTVKPSADDTTTPPTATAKIDRFGQFIAKDFSDKVRSVEELKADLEADEAYYASLTSPATDIYGGLADSGQQHGLQKTGFFHLGKIGDAQVLVTPDGNAFFQLGVCTALINIDDYTKVTGREAIFEQLPDHRDLKYRTAYRDGYKEYPSFYIANTIEKFDEAFSPDAHARRMIERLRKWGFNSSGAFGVNKDSAAAVKDAQFPYVTFLPLGEAPKLPLKDVWDPFAEGLEAKLDEKFAQHVATKANDPLIIGYFVTNEPVIEDVPKIVPGLPASKYAIKGRLVQMLQEKYPTIDAFNTAWGANYGAFDELGEAEVIIATPAANADMQAFFEIFLEARYSLIHRLFKKHDPNHLLIGDRWTIGSANNEAIVRIAGRYLDVISINYYTYGADLAFLDRVHKMSGGRPILLSEFHYCARDQGLTGGIRQLGTQQERGLAYRNYVEQAAATNYVVGVQWFSAIDQAATGRFFDNEAANIGLLNVADRPYKDFLAEVMKTNYDVYSVILGQRPPFAYDDPRFQMKAGGKKIVNAARMVKPFELDGSRNEWPFLPAERVGAEGLVLGEHAKDFEGTFRIAWDEQNLYLYAEVSDPTPMVNNGRADLIWANDAIELFTGADDLDQGGGLKFRDRQVVIRGAKTPDGMTPANFVNAPKQYDVRTIVLPNADGKGYTIEAAIPMESLGFTPQAGQEILFDIAFDDATIGRRQIVWNGSDRVSKDRSVWGKLAFTE